MKELSPEQVTDLIRHWDDTLDDPTADYPDTSPDADPSDLNADTADTDVCWADAPTASADPTAPTSSDVLFLDNANEDNNPSEHAESDVRYLGDIQKEIRDYFDDPSDVTNQTVDNRFSELKREGGSK